MDDLTTLLREAVEDVEPTDRRAELRERVAVSSKARRFRYAVTGGLLAAAVVVTGVAVAVQQSGDHETPPAGTKRAVDRSHERRPAYALYYVGETPAGPRLFREFRDGPGPETTPAAAISMLLSAPDDPDYTSYWSTGQLVGATVENERHRGRRRPVPGCRVLSTPWPSSRSSTRSRPRPADSRLPVQFVHDGNPVAEVGGLPTNEPLGSAPQLDVLALASISDPSDRRVVEGSFSANGRASSFEGNVPWQLKAPDGTVVMNGTAQSFGWDDHLYPWATGPIDVSDLEPGEYTFLVMTDDPSGGAEGAGPTIDTRTVIIK